MAFLFLDWEKAFDKIDHEELLKAIARYNLPEKILRIIKSLYDSPLFFIADKMGNSNVKRQTTGIRQGCPLSPYLFIMMMTVLIFDVHKNLRGKLTEEEYNFLNFWELLYADDTLLIGKDDKK